MVFLKVVVFLCALTVVYVNGESAEEIRKKFLDREKAALTKCQKEGNYPESYIDSFFVDEVVSPESKCYIHCYYGEMGTLQEDGFINLPLLLEDMKRLYISQDHAGEAIRIISNCYEKDPKVDKCESALGILDCSLKSARAGGYLKDVFHSEGH